MYWPMPFEATKAAITKGEMEGTPREKSLSGDCLLADPAKSLYRKGRSDPGETTNHVVPDVLVRAGERSSPFVWLRLAKPCKALLRRTGGAPVPTRPSENASSGNRFGKECRAGR